MFKKALNDEFEVLLCLKICSKFEDGALKLVDHHSGKYLFSFFNTKYHIWCYKHLFKPFNDFSDTYAINWKEFCQIEFCQIYRKFAKNPTNYSIINIKKKAVTLNITVSVHLSCYCHSYFHMSLFWEFTKAKP